MVVSLNKNNPKAKNPNNKDKMYNGKPVKPALYIGTWVGDGKYIAAQDEKGKLILDNNGKPISYVSI